MPMTLQQELQGVFSALGTTDYEAAIAAITTLKAGDPNAIAAAEDRDALFAALGATDRAGALTAWKDWQTKYSGLEEQVKSLDADKASLAGDLATAQTRITTLETSQKDFDGKVQAEVIKQAASAGLPAPLPKGSAPSGDAQTMSRSEFNRLTPSARMEFSKRGGRLTD